MTDKPKYQKKDARPATAEETKGDHRGGARGGRRRADTNRGGAEIHRADSHRGGRGGRGGAEIKPTGSGEEGRPRTSKGNFHKQRDGDQ